MVRRPVSRRTQPIINERNSQRERPEDASNGRQRAQSGGTARVQKAISPARTGLAAGAAAHERSANDDDANISSCNFTAIALRAALHQHSALRW
jgi:hypothetical protein